MPSLTKLLINGCLTANNTVENTVNSRYEKHDIEGDYALKFTDDEIKKEMI